jgi:hypothetical protein
MAAADAQFTTIAGEHFVAHKLALLGFVPAILRQSVRGIDLLVASQDGARSVPVQVETVASARRESPGAEQTPLLQFPLSQRSLEQATEETIYCFVDLQIRQPHLGPDVYVISVGDLRGELGTQRLRKYSYLRYVRPLPLLTRFRNNWEPFRNALMPRPAVTAVEGGPTFRALPLHPRLESWDLTELRDQPA